MKSLINLVTREATGARARFELFAADMLYTIASGNKIDMDKVERFGKELEKVYANPFEIKTEGPKTAEEIKHYLLGRITEKIKELGENTDGSNDISGEDHAG